MHIHVPWEPKVVPLPLVQMGDTHGPTACRWGWPFGPTMWPEAYRALHKSHSTSDEGIIIIIVC